MKKYEFHPLANLLPMMPDEGIQELADDIKENGLHEQLVLLDDQIIEGRNRYLACRIAKVEPSYRKYDKSIDGDDPAAFVESCNIPRRHLTPMQKAVAFAELRKARSVNLRSAESPTLEEDAKKAGVSPKTMDHVAKVVKSGAPEVVAAVKDETVSVSDASAVASLPKRKQKSALNKVKSGKAKTLKDAVKAELEPKHKSGKQTSDPRAWQRWDELFGKVKRSADDLNKAHPHANLCRKLHADLDVAFHTAKEWRRSLR